MCSCSEFELPLECTVKPVNKGHQRERQHMVFIDKWSLFGGYFVLFYQGRVVAVWPLFTGGLYSEVAFNTGWTVYACMCQ